MVRALDNGNDSAFRAGPEYTPDMATETLPLVRKIVRDMIALNKDIQAQREQLSFLDERESNMQDESYREEVRDIRRTLEDNEASLSACVNELNSLGIRPHQPFDGNIDFPAKRSRREIVLCWNPADESVCHWHEVDDTSGRRHVKD